MTQKSKAKQLVDRFIEPTIKYNSINEIGYYHDFESAKQCALIAIDEMILQETSYHSPLSKIVDYLEEVRQEIEKL